MNRAYLSLAGAVLAAIALAVSVTSLASADDTLPRYRLETGQVLTYESKYDFQHENGSFDDRTTWRIWVVDELADGGGWGLVVQKAERSVQHRDDGEDYEGEPRYNITRCTISPSGELSHSSWRDALSVNPVEVLPRLPQDESEISGGWRSVSQTGDSRDHTTAVTDIESGGSWQFELVKTTPLDEIYSFTWDSQVTFDLERGVVERVENRNTQGWGFVGEGTVTAQLNSIEMLDEQAIREFRTQADLLFDAKAAHDALTEQAQESHDPEQLLADAREPLASLEASGKITNTVLAEQLDKSLARLETMKSYYIERADSRAKVVGQPAADWETTDLAGNAHSLTDYRGKVVLLDFWYRGCGWCIRAMPQLKQLHEAYRDRPVAILSMNTDSDEADAQLVVEKMGLDYPTLKAEGLPEKYGVRGFPTLIVIDPEGVVHDMHVGYSPTLGEDLASTIDALLVGAESSAGE